MKSFCSVTLVAFLCAGCSTSEYQGEPTGESRVQFACDNNESVEMRFFPLQGVGVLVRNGTPMELQQQASASGFSFTNGPTTVRGKGDELIMEIGRMAPIRCQAQ